jgi:hypothetical protein
LLGARTSKGQLRTSFPGTVSHFSFQPDDLAFALQ